MVERPKCACGNLVALKDTRGGKPRYRRECNGCRYRRKGRKPLSQKYRRRTYRAHLDSVCTQCGFVPKHVCQLDIHHLDGNHNNNAEENLQTLCANCHRLVTLGSVN